MLLLALAAVSAAMLAACGGSDLMDSETAAEAKAASAEVQASEPSTTAVQESAEATVIETTAMEAAALPADNAASWSVVENGAQAFASRLDQATQSIASCETEAAAGENFAACLGRSFTAVADAGTDFVALIGSTATVSDGACRDELAHLKDAVQRMVDGYRVAIGIEDQTSLDTAYQRIGDDSNEYVTAAVRAATVCTAG